MKKVYFTLLFTVVSILGYSQEVKPVSDQEKLPTPKYDDDDTIYNTAGIEVKPDFPGGIKEFYTYIGKNYKVPDVKGLTGKVFVSFVIEKDGSLSDIKVLRDVGYGSGEEAVRVLKNSPHWSPAEQNGKKVRVLFMLPISIQPR